MDQHPLSPHRTETTEQGAVKPVPPGTPAARRFVALPLLILAAILVAASLAPAFLVSHAAPKVSEAYTQTSSIYVRVVRTGWGEASVLGVQNGTGASVSVSIFVNGVATNTTSTIYNGEFWRLHVPVANGSTVQAGIGNNISDPVPVPAYVPQPVGAPGMIYAQGSQLFVNGTPIQLFGVDEETGFTYAMIADGLCGWTNPSQYWGDNQLFPSGPGSQIPGVSSVDQYWQKFFQYFLHYNQVAGNATNPKTNVIRITIVDDTFVPEGAYNAWKNNPTAFWHIFDSMLYWAGQAGLYVVPVLGHIAQRGTSTVESWYNTSSPQFAHQIALVRAILARYNNNTRIAMWDLWNEPDVNNDAYWTSVGGITAFRAWVETYTSDVKPYSSNHLITMGLGDWTLFPGVPSYGWQWYFFFNDIPGLEVGSNHYYATAQDSYLISWPTAWHNALNIPEFQGEFGYSASGGNSLGYGYWPWFAQNAMASGWSLATMVYLDDGMGPYADYPYLGPLPAYPNGTVGPAPTPSPIASFSVTPSSPVAGAPAKFDGSLSSDTVAITSYGWTFGDGGTATGMVVNHTYGSAGTYTASLTVTDTDGSSNRTSRAVQVLAGGAPPGSTTPPSVTTFAASSKGQTTATLNGNLGSLGSGAPVTVGFRYGSSPTLSGAMNVTAASLAAPGAFSENVNALTPGATYYFAAWANGTGFAAGSVLSFVAMNAGTLAPHASTHKPRATSATTATLTGNVSSLGSASTVNVGFLFGTDPTLSGARNVTVSMLSGPGEFDLSVASLSPSTTYYYEAWAAGQGFALGGILNVTTSAISSPATAPAVLGVTYSPDAQRLDIAFSQPMNRTSVANALVLSPSVRFQVAWVDDSHLQLELDPSLVANQVYGLTVESSATSAAGQPLADAFTFSFTAPPTSGVREPSLLDALGGSYLPWISLALAAGAAIVLLLYLRSRRKYRRLTQTARVLARRIEELRAINKRSASPSQGTLGRHPVATSSSRKPLSGR